MNIVMKLTEISSIDISWSGVVKLSDEVNKHTGQPRMIELAQEILGVGKFAPQPE